VLHQLFGTDSQKTSVSLLILLTHLLISPILRLHFSQLHSIHNWKPSSSSYISHPYSIPAPQHIRNHHQLQPKPHSVSLAWPSRMLTLHLNETRSLDIADLVWYSAGLRDVAFVSAEKFSEIYINSRCNTIGRPFLYLNSLKFFSVQLEFTFSCIWALWSFLFQFIVSTRLYASSSWAQSLSYCSGSQPLETYTENCSV